MLERWQIKQQAGLALEYDPAAHTNAARLAHGSGGSVKTVTVQAKGSSAGGIWPAMQIWLNGVQQGGDTSVNNTSYSAYTFNLALSGKICFPNHLPQHLDQSRGVYIMVCKRFKNEIAQLELSDLGRKSLAL